MKSCKRCGCPMLRLHHDKVRVLCVSCAEVPIAPKPQRRRNPNKLLIEDMALVKAARRALTERQKKWQRT